MFIYILFSYLVTVISTKEIKARIYKVENNQYEFIEEQEFEKKSEFTPPEGKDIYVEYVRSESPVWVKIVSNVIIQAVMLFQAFKILASVLAQPGHREKKEGNDPYRGYRIGLIAAIPAFCVYIAYVIATALKWGLARPIFCVFNITFRPFLDAVFAFSDNVFSVWNALATIVVVAVIPLVTQAAFVFGHKFSQIDYKKLMYKKESK